MRLHQLSLFLENRPGQLRAPCQVLAQAGVDILTTSLADTAQFGILRLVVRDWQKAKAALEAAGMVVNVTEVVPVEVEDRPGGLLAALSAIDQAGLGIEYMYAFAAGTKAGKAAVVLRFQDVGKAEKALLEAGIRVLAEEELLGRM
ncbi:MAG: amino acid-binding protein [Deltaproteobacteria bacterium]|nr:amino acid-binding protein [Deltaproteobacteria bacterium]